MNNKITAIVLEAMARTHQTIIDRLADKINEAEAKDQFDKISTMATDNIEDIIKEEDSFHNDCLNG